MKHVARKLLLLAGLAAGFAPVAMADDDSSSDAVGGFAKSVQESEAVIIRVPLDAAGNELSTGAEMRLHAGADVTLQSDVATAFAAAKEAGDQPQVDINSDSSTSRHYYGWGRWYGNYNYRYYTPTYYYGAGSWAYNYGYSYNYYYRFNNYYGYRYYYYRRCW